MSSDQITADDLDELEDAPAAVAAPIDPATSEDVPSSAPAVDSDEAAIEPALDTEGVSDSDEPVDDEIVLINAELEVSNKRVSRTRSAYENALAENSEINQRLGIALMAAGDVPLHVLNRMQDKITRPEDHKRLTAKQAISDLQGHFRPGKRDYPVHPSARALVDKPE